MNSAEILLVEDNPHDAELTIRALRKNHLTNSLLHVSDGVEALEYLLPGNARESQILPRLILLDLKLPRVNGIEVLQAIKKNDLTKTIPVVVLTSSREQPDLVKCYQLGVNSYVVKPVEFEEFMKTVSDLGLYWLMLNQTDRK